MFITQQIYEVDNEFAGPVIHWHGRQRVDESSGQVSYQIPLKFPRLIIVSHADVVGEVGVNFMLTSLSSVWMPSLDGLNATLIPVYRISGAELGQAWPSSVEFVSGCWAHRPVIHSSHKL